MQERALLWRKPWAWALAIFLIAGAASIALWTRRAGGPAHVSKAEKNLRTLGKVPDFSLVERSGKKIRLADLLGNVWIADLIYTHCTDTCPIQSAEMKSLQDKFAAAPDLRLVSITVDPKRDTPAVLRKYAARFGADPARWLFLTGDERAIYRLAQEGFHLAAAEIPKAERDGSGATHLHSPRFVLVDRAAEIRGYYAGTEKAALARLGGDVEILLGNSK